jgi:hypothetical protein
LIARLAFVVGLACAVGTAFAAPTLAHSDDGIFSGLDAAPGSQPLEVSVRARLVYANDSEPAPGATVNVDAVAADGAATPPSPLRDNGDGTYEGVLTLPAAGNYTLRFTAATPLAAADAPYAAPATTATTTTTAAVPSTQPRDVDDDDSSRGAAPIVAGFGGVAVIGVGVAAFLLWRRRGTT